MLDSLFILVQMISLTVLLTWALREDSNMDDRPPEPRSPRRRQGR
jgi:hypothetical protein